MSILLTQHQYHHPHHRDSLPSMEQYDNGSDTDTDTVIDTPTSLKSTMYDPSSWLPSNFDYNIHPSQRPLSSPLLSDTTKYNDKSKNAMENHSFTNRRVSSPSIHHETIENSTYPTSTYQYHTTIRRMSQHIDDFLQSRQEHTNNHVSLKKSYLDQGRGPSSVTSTGDLIEMIHEFRDHLNSDTTTTTTPHQAQQLCDTMLAWLQHSPTATALDHEKKKNKRLVQSIQQLAQRHHTSKQTHRSELKTIRGHQNLRQHNKMLTDRLQQEIQTRKEAEDILDSVRIEMETMMGELNTAKQQLFTAEQETQHVRDQWESIIHGKNDNDTTFMKQGQVDPWALLTLQQEDWEHRMDTMTDEIQRLTKENQDRHELKGRLLQAERQAAEYDLKLVVLKSQQYKQQQQLSIKSKDKEDEKDELIMALQHELVEKKSALARWDKKWQQQTKQWQQQQAALHQSHLADHQAWQEEYKAECQKQQDLDFVRVTRDTRALEGQLLDLTLEKERLEACIVEHQQRWHRMDQQYKARETTWAIKQSQWDNLEKEAKAIVLELEQKIIGLEADTVRLYGKNIILAKQLGECD